MFRFFFIQIQICIFLRYIVGSNQTQTIHKWPQDSGFEFVETIETTIYRIITKLMQFNRKENNEKKSFTDAFTSTSLLVLIMSCKISAAFLP